MMTDLPTDHRPYATLAPGSPRAGDWLRVFGRLDHIPLQHVAPQLATLPGFAAAVYIYLLDLARLTPEQYERLVEFISSRFQAPLEEVRAGLAEQGLPLLADDVYAVQVLPLRLVI